MAYIPQGDWLINVAKGLVSGHSIVRVLARNTDIDLTEEDIWFSGGTLTYLSSAQRMNIVSTSVNDTSAGTGVRTVKISGLDNNYAQITENVTMNGTSNVLTTNSYLRVNEIESLTAGTTHATIPTGENVSAKSHYTIPAGKTGYLLDFMPSLAAAKQGADVTFRARELGSTFKMKSRMSVQSNGASVINHQLSLGPVRLPEKTDVKVVGVGSSNDQDISCEYILLLVDN